MELYYYPLNIGVVTLTFSFPLSWTSFRPQDKQSVFKFLSHFHRYTKSGSFVHSQTIVHSYLGGFFDGWLLDWAWNLEPKRERRAEEDT